MHDAKSLRGSTKPRNKPAGNILDRDWEKNGSSDVQDIIQSYKSTIKYKHEWQQVIRSTVLTTEMLFRP